MAYSTFNKNKNDQLKEPMFLGQSVNVARYDQQKHPFIESLVDRQLSFFWRPDEIDCTRDKAQFEALPEHEKHIFVSNLQYQTLLDSVQGRSPNVALLPLVSLPELETWIETWSFSETIHSRSYTHIIRNLFNDPSVVFDEIVEHPEIQKRAAEVTKYYDQLIDYTFLYHSFGLGEHVINDEKITISLRELKKHLFMCVMATNILEAIRFYVSFACTFAFAERDGLLDGNSSIMKLIARDEQLHMAGTQYMLNVWRNGTDDLEMAEIFQELKADSEELFKRGAEQEKEWARYLFKDGSMLGLNEQILCSYVEYITNIRMKAVGLSPAYPGHEGSNPIPWISNWLVSENVQVAPQEKENTAYQVGQISNDIDSDALAEFKL